MHHTTPARRRLVGGGKDDHSNVTFPNEAALLAVTT